ncbi:MAG: hypothetical protein RLZZ269_1185 [Actinomycetota bacterium]
MPAPPPGPPPGSFDGSQGPSSGPTCGDVCGYAVVGNDGVVHGVIVCQEGCFGGVMPIDYMGCPAGCSLVLQSPADSNGNVAGVHGPNVVYTPSDNTFRQIGGDGTPTWTLVGGEPLDSAVVIPPPPPVAPPEGPTEDPTPNPPSPDPLPSDGYAAPSGEVYESVAELVTGESIVSVTSSDVTVQFPSISDGSVGYLAFFDPVGPQPMFEVERGELGAEVTAMSVGATGSNRLSLSIDRSRFGKTRGKLVVALASESEWIGVVATTLQVPKKYANCKSLQKDYPSGVSRAVDVVDKGRKPGAPGPLPIVNPDVYNLNKKLDRDKDGIACEK